MDAPRLVNADLLGRNAGSALNRKRRAQCRRALALGRDQHESAAVEPAIGVLVVKVTREIGEHIERSLRERDIFRHRVVRAHDARRLCRRSSAELAAIEQEHATRIEAREMTRDRRADDAAADHDRVEPLHGFSGQIMRGRAESRFFAALRA